MSSKSSFSPLVIVLYALMFAGLITWPILAGCGALERGARAGADQVVDCGKGELGNLRSIAGAMAKPLIAGELTWADVEAAMIGSGARVGGCIAAHLHDLLPKKQGLVGVPTEAELALQHLRDATGTKYSYRTDEGTL